MTLIISNCFHNNEQHIFTQIHSRQSSGKLFQSHNLDLDPMRNTWWRHQMETVSALLALCAGNSPVTGEFPSKRPVTRCFDVFFDLRLNKHVNRQSRRRWFETSSRSLWRHCNVDLDPMRNNSTPAIIMSSLVAICVDAKSAPCQFV